MKIRWKSKIDLQSLCFCPIYFSLVYFFFANIFDQLFSFQIAGLIYMACVVGAWGIYGVRLLRTSRFNISGCWAWVLVVMLFSCRERIFSGDLYWAMMYIILTLIMFIASTGTQWFPRSVALIYKLSLVHIFATILLYICSPYLYNTTMLHFWGQAPAGISLGEGYKAGISAHYSTNGTYCALGVIFLVCRFFATNKLSKKGVVLLLFSVLALLLTTKRAHILFSIFTIAVVYYCCYPENKPRKAANILLAGICGLTLFLVLYPIVPMFSAIVDRFVGDEDISNGRFLFWSQALELFVDNKLFGIGWGSFANVNVYKTGAHNVYVQLLCETGIVGFAAFVFAMGKTYVMTLKDWRKYGKRMLEPYREILVLSLAIQTFIIAYCFTGNCLFDMNVIIYYLACSMALSLHQALRKQGSRLFQV